MRYGILGGGFGLYGYLPAIAGLNPKRIVTLEKYRATIRRRPELADIEKRISFVDSENMVLDGCDVLVVAQRPADQEKIVADLAPTPWAGTLVLEKPIARNPALAQGMLQRLEAGARKFTIGFSILETDWAQDVIKSFRAGAAIHIEFQWRFLAHHYRNNLDNWKRRPSEGGGALRFYAIHLVALLAQLGDWVPVSCLPPEGPEEDPLLESSFQSGNCRATLHCDSRWQEEPMFEVKMRQGDITILRHRLANPFSNQSVSGGQAGVPDLRIVFLQRLLSRLAGPHSSPDRTSRAHLRLWTALEQLRENTGARRRD